ncbi:hypothetical protein [Methylobacterium sp. E-045]|jgi:hypothetical protein|uniref:hypothetical protein n=1 Tax=Methylobacterium sp. E-045 TaxID=2836575 RepID=UPI001FB953E8|nr:hypothetical protein [Methylobacterium sp. E-045]MCJ2129285.1 hypothetical protein [Methylobacterium sp. E-045]
MRPTAFLVAAGLFCALGACNSADRSGLSDSFSTENYRRSNDTNGTQTRRDVNRAYTAPSMPSIVSRGN